MHALNRTQQAQLAKEITANRPIPEWDSISDLKRFKQSVTLKGKDVTMNFEDLVVKYKDIDQEIKYRQEIMKTLKESIEAAVLISGEEKILCSGYRVARVVKRGARKIVPERLLELGISADTIAKATEEGAESAYIEIRKAKED
jgi:hypothetical protein